MMPRFELFLEVKKKDTYWVPTNWADYMDPNVMTTLLGDAILSIEEEEYWEAYQHALKNPYEARTDDENDGKGEAPSDDDKGSGSGSGSEDNNSDSEDCDSDDNGDGNGGDNSSDDSDSEGSNNEDYGS